MENQEILWHGFNFTNDTIGAYRTGNRVRLYLKNGRITIPMMNNLSSLERYTSYTMTSTKYKGAFSFWGIRA